MQTVDMSFKGNPFTIVCADGPLISANPSWFTYSDESSVRDRDWNIKPGDFVLDVGAGFGSYAVTALAAGASYVWAWSPQGFGGVSEAEYLRRTLEVNGWSERCTIIEAGVYSSSGWLDTVKQALYAEDPGPNPDVIRVETLDDWAARTRPQKVDWMKLDVEGAEVEVFTGALSVIRRHKPVILVENHLFVRPTLRDEVEAILAKEGYRHVHTVPHHGVSHSAYVPVTTP